MQTLHTILKSTFPFIQLLYYTRFFRVLFQYAKRSIKYADCSQKISKICLIHPIIGYLWYDNILNLVIKLQFWSSGDVVFARRWYYLANIQMYCRIVYCNIALITIRKTFICIGIPKHWRLSVVQVRNFYYLLDFYVFNTRRKRHNF